MKRCFLWADLHPSWDLVILVRLLLTAASLPDFITFPTQLSSPRSGGLSEGVNCVTLLSAATLALRIGPLLTVC